MKRAPILFLLLAGCVTNPYTGRSQLILVDRNMEIRMGVEAYQEMLAKEPVCHDPRFVAPAMRVVGRLVETVKRGWVTQEGVSVPAPGYAWEARVVMKPEEPNAWCLPGGKMAVYTGIYPALHDENGMAIVMGHEISHALLRHGVERVSQGLMAELGKTVLTGVLGGDDPEDREEMYALIGLGMSVGILLPFSREQETEADWLGLQLAAKAGFDPRAGIAVWERMAKAGGGGGVEFLSTHPGHDTRIANMRAWMPDAMALYEASPKRTIALLPRPSEARAVASSGGGGGVPGFSARGCAHDNIQGKAAVSFEFAMSRAAYLKEVHVSGPGGIVTTLPIGAPLEANAPRRVNIWRASPADPPLPPGRWTLTFRGNSSGEPFSKTVRYSLP